MSTSPSVMNPSAAWPFPVRSLRATSVAAVKTAKISESHKKLLDAWPVGATQTSTEAEKATGISAHKRFPEMVKRGLIRKQVIDGVVQTRGTPKATVYEVVQ